MSKYIICLLFMSFVFFKANAQNTLLVAEKSAVSSALEKKLAQKLRKYQVFSLNIAQIVGKQKSKINFSLQSPLEKWDINLYPHEIRASSEKILPDCPTFAGTVNSEFENADGKVEKTKIQID